MGHILFNTPGVTPPGGGAQEEYFDNTKWSPGTYGSWNVDEWVGETHDFVENTLNLDVLGTWAQGFRPADIRITITSSIDLTISLKDTGANEIASYTSGVNPPTTEFTLSINWGNGLDIDSLELFAIFSTSHCTNIEFLD